MSIRARVPKLIEYPDLWQEPFSGWEIPMRPEPNVRFRKSMLLRAENDSELQDFLLYNCRRSFSFWANLFVWTYRQSRFDAQGRQTALTGDASLSPWICWPVHDKLHAYVSWCVKEGRDLVIDKSRETKLTWHMTAEAAHQLIFVPNSTSLLISRKQDLVDSHDPDSLFFRLRFILSMLPEWMVPPLTSTFMHLGNKLLGEDAPWSIDGESTVDSVGVGGRKTFVGIDEASRNRHLEAIWNATKSTSRTRIAWSTPLGPGFFKDLCVGEAGAGAVRFTIDYRYHPEMGRNPEVRNDDAQGTYTGQAGIPFVWTPWLENEVMVQRRSKRDIAQNIFVNHDDAGQNAFDIDVLNRQRTAAEHLNAQTPPITGDLVTSLSGEARDVAIRKKDISELKFHARDKGRGSLTLYMPLVNGRPPQNRAYCMGADISNGLSGSNTVVKIGDAITGEVVGIFVSSALGAEQFGRVFCELGHWLGGMRGCAYMIWEANGPGQSVEKVVRDLRYPRFYTDEQGNTGWWNDPYTMIEAIEGLRAAYSSNRLQERCVDTLRECGDYIWIAGPRIICGRLREDRDAQATHGDRVIATMLMWKSMEKAPRMQEVPVVLGSRVVAERIKAIKQRDKPKPDDD